MTNKKTPQTPREVAESALASMAPKAIEEMPPVKNFLDEKLCVAIEDTTRFREDAQIVLEILKKEAPGEGDLRTALNYQIDMFIVAGEYRKYERTFNAYMRQIKAIKERLDNI